MIAKLEYKLIHPDAKLPYRKRTTDAGYDLYSIEDIVIYPRVMIDVRTGICISCPAGWYMTIEGRSGMSRMGIIPFRGIIDATYCGELCVALTNISESSYQINKGDRIAQLILHQVHDFQMIKVTEFSPEYNQRGQEGFGSSGR